MKAVDTSPVAGIATEKSIDLTRRKAMQGRMDEHRGEITSSRRVAIIGTRYPPSEGMRPAAKLARSFVKDDFTLVFGLAARPEDQLHF